MRAVRHERGGTRMLGLSGRPAQRSKRGSAQQAAPAPSTPSPDVFADEERRLALELEKVLAGRIRTNDTKPVALSTTAVPASNVETTLIDHGLTDAEAFDWVSDDSEVGGEDFKDRATTSRRSWLMRAHRDDRRNRFRVIAQRVVLACGAIAISAIVIWPNLT